MTKLLFVNILSFLHGTSPSLSSNMLYLMSMKYAPCCNLVVLLHFVINVRLYIYNNFLNSNSILEPLSVTTLLIFSLFFFFPAILYY